MVILHNIPHKTAIELNKSILKPIILFTIPFLICLNILFCFWPQLNIKQKLPLNMSYTSFF